jgi:hypothetical protein
VVLVLLQAGRSFSLTEDRHCANLTACQGLVLIIPQAGRGDIPTAVRSWY